VIEHQEMRDVLAAAVGRLPEPQREAVALAYWGEMAASEVATRTSVPLGTAKSRLRLGLARLRSDLAGPLGQPSGA
jgi:RNA polymerase sigma-70 factor (ECF subfamily)